MSPTSAGSRPQSRTSCPTRARWIASAVPQLPAPMTATVRISHLLAEAGLQTRLARREEAGLKTRLYICSDPLSDPPLCSGMEPRQIRPVTLDDERRGQTAREHHRQGRVGDPRQRRQRRARDD
jgi:hypothetical protein